MAVPRNFTQDDSIITFEKEEDVTSNLGVTFRLSPCFARETLAMKRGPTRFHRRWRINVPVPDQRSSPRGTASAFLKTRVDAKKKGRRADLVGCLLPLANLNNTATNTSFTRWPVLRRRRSRGKLACKQTPDPALLVYEDT